MTITSTAVKITANGDGLTTVFNYAFLIPNQASAVVIYTDASGAQTTLTPAQYSITGLGNAAGGSVTYPLIGSPIAIGTSLTVTRVVPLVQLTSVQNQSGFYADQVEAALDYLTEIAQQINDASTRTLQAPVVDPSATLVIPAVAQRKNLFLGFDGSGQPIAGIPVATSIVSSAMSPVVSAATLAAGRSAFGLGAVATEGIGASLQDDGAGNLRVNWLTVPVSTAQAVTAAFHLKRYIATGPMTFTLPRVNTLWNGFGFWIEAYSNNVTVAIDSHDAFVGGSTGVSLVIPAGWKIFFETDAAASGTIYYVANPPLIVGTGLVQQGLQTIFVPAGSLTARTTNGAAFGSVEMATNKEMFITKDFDPSTQQFCQFLVWMPKSWDLGTVTFQPMWSHPATTTNFGVVFGLAAVAVATNSAGDVAFGTAQTSTSTGGTTNNLYFGPKSSAITIAGSPATDAAVFFQINRTVADVNDTMAVNARLHGIRLLYSTNAPNDA